MGLQASRADNAELDARAAVRTTAEQAVYEGKLKACEDTPNDTGNKPPPRPTAGPRATDQLNLTDPDSRVVPGPGGSFEQSYNAEAAVDTDTMWVGGHSVPPRSCAKPACNETSGKSHSRVI